MPKIMNVVASVIVVILAMGMIYAFHVPVMAWLGEMDDLYIRGICTLAWFMAEFFALFVAPALMLTQDNLFSDN